MNIEVLEAELMKLSPKRKAVITYKLLKSLENESSQDFYRNKEKQKTNSN